LINDITVVQKNPYADLSQQLQHLWSSTYALYVIFKSVDVLCVMYQ